MLTEKYGGKNVAFLVDDNFVIIRHPETGQRIEGKLVDTVTAYQDTGLSPEEVAKLKAERDAAIEDMRLIVGDVISEKSCYICEHYVDGNGCNDPEAENDDGECHWQWRGLEASQ